jgi:hypothetical protein
LGQTSAPLDALNGFTQETNAANLETDAAMEKLHGLGIPVDFHLSGALTNNRVAAAATWGENSMSKYLFDGPPMKGGGRKKKAEQQAQGGYKGHGREGGRYAPDIGHDTQESDS